MIDPKLFKGDLAPLVFEMSRRGARVPIEQLASLESTRKSLQIEADALRAQRKRISFEVGVARGRGEDAAVLMAQSEAICTRITQIEQELSAALAELTDIQQRIPNILHASVPTGLDEGANVLVRGAGTPPTFSFKPLDHVAVGARLGMDFEAASAISGSRFVVLRGPLAQLQRALAQFMIDLHVESHGYEQIYVPYIVEAAALLGTGQLPKFEQDLFCLTGATKRYLIPTSEVPLTNLVRGATLTPDQLPQRYVAHSPCFRSEAGSAGRDTRGMIRQHQFEKVELVQIVAPEESYGALETMTLQAEAVLRALGLAYRVIALCAGDTGFGAAKTYDLEVWLPSQGTYREISSVSNCEAFQARRLAAKWRNPKTGKTEYVHTLNGSGVAVGRALVAILENFQLADGSVVLPEVLVPYMHGIRVLKPCS